MCYKIIKAIVKPFFMFFCGVSKINREKFKYDAKMIVVSNHLSNWDPVFMHLAVKPKVRFMAKSELFKNPFLRAIIKFFGAFPVDRGHGDLNSVKNAFVLLKNGETLGIFPEGTRSKSGELLPFHPGAAMIALRTDTKILPIYFTKKIGLFSGAKMIAGDPIDVKACAGLSDTASVKEVTKMLKSTIAQMKTDYEDGKYAGRR